MMDLSPEGPSRQGSQVLEVIPLRTTQMFVYPSSPNISVQLAKNSNNNNHKHVKLSNRFKRLLAIAAGLSMLSLGLFICSCLSPQWEKLEFLFDKIILKACAKDPNRTWSLVNVYIGNGKQAMRFNNQTRLEVCHRWKQSPPRIVGVEINARQPNGNSTIIEVFDIRGGAFQVCYERYTKRGLKAFIRSSLDKNITDCFNYIINGSKWKGSGCRQMALRMQNNLIACLIIVFLCIVSSGVVGAIGVLARMVPAALVNAYLYLVACVFIIFANCIEHIKISHLQSKWGPCYPLANYPVDFYDPQLIRVHFSWAVYMNWAIVGVFLATTTAWFMLKQILYLETAKSMI